MQPRTYNAMQSRGQQSRKPDDAPHLVSALLQPATPSMHDLMKIQVQRLVQAAVFLSPVQQPPFVPSCWH